MDPFIGQIVMFAGNFAPRGWAFCNGQLLAISSNQALFSILGTTYGGDGRTTFGLPDLRGRTAMHPGTGPGLTERRLGQKGGAESVTLTEAQVPSHSHTVGCVSAAGSTKDPKGALLAGSPGQTGFYHPAPASDTMADTMLNATGGGQSHDNMAPFGCVNYIIALVGVFPSRS